MRRIVIPVGAWVVTLAALVPFGGLLVSPPSWARWVSVAIFALLLPITAWSPLRRLPASGTANRGGVLVTLAAAAVAVVLIGGGVGSFLSLAIACPLILSLEWYGRERTVWHTLALFGTALLLDVFLVGRLVEVHEALASLLGVSAFLLVAAQALAPRAALQEELSRVDAHGLSGAHGGAPRVAAADLQRIEGSDPSLAAAASGEASPGSFEQNSAENGNSKTSLGEPADPRSPGTAGSGSGSGEPDAPWVELGSHTAVDLPAPTVHLEPDILGRRLQLGSRQWWRSGGENRVIAEYLLDLRASTGADEAVVWLLNDGDSVLRPLAACSSNQWAAHSNSDKKWMALVRWSCEAAVVQVGESENGGGYVTAPLAIDGRMLGVLCLRRGSPFDENVEQLKTRVTHHASFVARLTMLVDTHASSVARSEALDNALEAVRDLQDRAPVESPSSAICDAVLQVCGCDASALVRWHSEVISGTVEAGAGVFESYEQGPVQAGSIVGSTCQRATPFRVGATHDLFSRLSLFRKDEQVGQLGAISVQPMKRDGEVIGALVAGWNAPTDMAAYSAPSMEVLASVGAHALHAAWRLETVQLAARTDALTGLSNRRYLDEQLSRVLAEAGRYGDPASLILLDLDYFKLINDTHGHAVGDMVLKHVAETLLDGIRGVDLCARYGGEELAVLLPRTGLERAVDIAERLRSMVEARPFALSGRSIRITASFGVASFPSAAPGPSGLLSSADGALYRAKEDGRNRVRCASPTS